MRAESQDLRNCCQWIVEVLINSPNKTQQGRDLRNRERVRDRLFSSVNYIEQYCDSSSGFTERDCKLDLQTRMQHLLLFVKIGSTSWFIIIT